MAEVHKAVLEGRLEDLQGLLDNTLLAGAVDRTGLPLLHKAVLFQHDELVEWLISEFADMLDTKDNVRQCHSHSMTYVGPFSLSRSYGLLDLN